MNQRHLGWIAVLFLTSCSGDDGGGVEPENNAPTISFQFNKIGIVKNTPTTMSVNVDDLDGDPLTVTWTPTRGTITSLNAEDTQVRWNPPNTVGIDTITVTVSDGSASRSIQEAIKVGTLFNGSIAPLLFRKDQSPYIVSVTGSPPVLLIEGATTIIEAGTEILLETEDTEFSVTDSLIAVGTSSEPIAIRPNIRHLTCGEDRGWWSGIKVANYLEEGYLEMAYGSVWYAQWGVRLRDSGSARIRDSVIRCSGNNGILHESSGMIVVENTRISDGLLDGIAFRSIALYPDSVRVSRCNVAFNGRVGIVFDLPPSVSELPILVQYTNIESNYEHGLTLSDSVLPKLHYNRFFSNGVVNGLSNIHVYSCSPGPCTGVVDLDAACNYWGSGVTSSFIQQTIRDATDDATRSIRVVFTPWSNENPLVGPSSCVVP